MPVYTPYLQYLQSICGVAAMAKQMLCTKCTIVVFILVENMNPFLQKGECIVCEDSIGDLDHYIVLRQRAGLEIRPVE